MDDCEERVGGQLKFWEAFDVETKKNELKHFRDYWTENVLGNLGDVGIDEHVRVSLDGFFQVFCIGFLSMESPTATMKLTLRTLNNIKSNWETQSKKRDQEYIKNTEHLLENSKKYEHASRRLEEIRNENAVVKENFSRIQNQCADALLQNQKLNKELQDLRIQLNAVIKTQNTTHEELQREKQRASTLQERLESNYFAKISHTHHDGATLRDVIARQRNPTEVLEKYFVWVAMFVFSRKNWRRAFYVYAILLHLYLFIFTYAMIAFQ